MRHELPKEPESEEQGNRADAFLRAKRFFAFLVIEEAVFAWLLIWGYGKHPAGMEPLQIVETIASFEAAIAVSGISLFLMNRDIEWADLRISDKVLRIIAGMIVTAAVFYIALVSLSVLTGMYLTQRGAINLAVMAGAGIGGFGLFGVFFTRECGPGFTRSEEDEEEHLDD